MPSGAKKRKAAKKKLQKAYNNGAHLRANENPRSNGSDVDNHEEGIKEVSLGEETAAEISDGELKKEEENMNDVSVESEEHKSSSSSSGGSTSSGSDNEEVVVEKEKSVVLESSETEDQDESLNPEVVVAEEVSESVENLPEENVSSEVFEESVPIEESIKQVVSSQEVIVAESVRDESIAASEASEAGVKLIVEEVLPKLDEKDQISSVVTNLVDESVPEPVDITTRENEALLPPSSGVTTVERNGRDGHHVTESVKQPLVSFEPVRRTSWMDCCGLFEAVSGGSSR